MYYYLDICNCNFFFFLIVHNMEKIYIFFFSCFFCSTYFLFFSKRVALYSSKRVRSQCFRARRGGHICLFHQLDVGEPRQLHQEPGRLPVRHHLQDGERLLHAQGQGHGALPEAGREEIGRLVTFTSLVARVERG